VGEATGELFDSGALLAVCVGETEVICSTGSSAELKIEATQTMAINPPMVESDPRFSLTF
jgi:hypothetical protein